jgi:hypothetical protein
MNATSFFSCLIRVYFRHSCALRCSSSQTGGDCRQNLLVFTFSFVYLRVLLIVIIVVSRFSLRHSRLSTFSCFRLSLNMRLQLLFVLSTNFSCFMIHQASFFFVGLKSYRSDNGVSFSSSASFRFSLLIIRFLVFFLIFFGAEPSLTRAFLVLCTIDFHEDDDRSH